MPVTVYFKNGNQSEQEGGESVDHDWFVPGDARTPRVILVKAADGVTIGVFMADEIVGYDIGGGDTDPSVS